MLLLALLLELVVPLHYLGVLRGFDTIQEGVELAVFGDMGDWLGAKRLR